MSQIGIPGSATFAETLSGIEEMLDVLPNNTANEISAQRMRNVVYTLYQDLQGASFSEFVYTDSNSTVAVGGVPLNTSFASMSLFTIFNKLFHKDYGPSSTLKFFPSSTTTVLDYKGEGSASYSAALQAAGVLNPTVAANSGFDELVSYQLEWSATKATFGLNNAGTITRTPVPTLPQADGNPLFRVFVPTVGGSDKTPTTKPKINVFNEYVFNCTDDKGTSAGSPKVSISYGHRFYWGSISLSSPRELTSLEIRSLIDAGKTTTNLSSGSFITVGFGGTNVAKISFVGINGAGNYLCWAFPTSYGTPKFYVGGFYNTDFTKVNPAFSYRNIYGYEQPYDVWMTNVKYPTAADIELR